MVSTSQKRICMVYIPLPTKRAAKKIATILVKEKLAACANILGPSMSLYAWKGKVAKSREFIMLLKTTEAKFLKLEKRIVELHPNDCPCIVKIAVSSVHSPYLNWLVKTVS